VSLKNLIGVSLEQITPDAATVPTTLGVESRTVMLLDRLRKQRNVTEYSGDVVPESAVAECLSQAQALYAITLEWLRANHPELMT